MPAQTDHESFPQPSSVDIPVWRYLDLSKYLDLLCNSRLFFSRSDLLGDPFEGSTPKFNHFAREHMLKRRRSDPSINFYKDMSDDQIRDMYRQYAIGNQQAVKEYFISCWHMNELESAAMWKLYSKSDDSVCVSSTYKTLVSQMPEYVYAGALKYVDYTREFISEQNGFNFIMHKRKSFEHEREVRFLIWDHSKQNPSLRNSAGTGVSVNIDVNSVIQKVYINPTAQAWFADLVEGLTKRLGGEFEVAMSSLSESPMY